MLVPEHAIKRLREAGLRLTPQRRAVVDTLIGDTSHPLAEEVASRVAERMPGTSLSTVYKTLHELSDLGLVRRLDTPSAMRFDPDVSDHAHLICRDCARLFDVPVPPSVNQEVRAAVTAEGGCASRIEVVIHGTCALCTAGASSI